MNLPDVFVCPELAAFAARAGVSPYRMALAFGDPTRFAAILTSLELAALKVAVTPRVARRPNTARLLGTA